MSKGEFENKLLGILRSKKEPMLKTCSVDKLFIRKIFREKYAESVHEKLILDHYSILVNSLKYS